MTILFVAALAALVLAAATDLLTPVRAAAPWLPYAIGGVAAAGFAVVGADGLTGRRAEVGLDGWVGLGPAALSIDRLSALFLLIAFAVAAPVCVVAADWSRGQSAVPPRGLGAATALLLAAVAVIVTADHVFVFLFGWELLTLAFYLITASRRRDDTVTPSLLTLVFGKASGQLAMLGLLVGAAQVDSFHLPDLTHLPGGTTRAAVYVLLVAGFAVKIGLAPGQVWMPAGYSAAPGPLRALLAGAAVNVGFYGLWRTAALLGPPPAWLPVVLLLIGGLTAVGGIAHAAVQERLTRIIAYSSVENAGLIVVGYAIALIGLDAHSTALTGIGLLAASLQMIAHAIAKSALFSAAGVIGSAYGTDDMETLRGIGRRMPTAGTALAIGSITLAGLPPTIGFVSEWFLLEAIAQQFRLGALPRQIALAIAGALVALTAGFAGVAFTRVVGFTVLGRGGPPPSGRTPTDPGLIGRMGLAALALGCLVVAVLTPLEIRLLAAGLSPVVSADATLGALRSPWVLQPVYSDFSALSPTWLWIMMPALFLATIVGVWLLSRGGMSRVRRVHPGGPRRPEWMAPTSTRRSATPTPPARFSPRS